MAINDAMQAFTSQQNAAAGEYKDAWASAPSAGLGQFGSSAAGAAGAVPFVGKPAALASAVESVKPAQSLASTVMQAKPMQMGAAPAAGAAGTIDALPTTPVGAASTDPIQAAIETTSNYSTASPYVSDVTDAGDVGRQSTRPERLAIDDTMSAEEQYRRAWQNESNGFYGNEVAATEKPAAEVATNKPAEIVKPASVEYGIDYTDSTDAQDPIALVYDKATGRIVKQFDSSETVGLSQKLNGAETVNSDDLKKHTGWEAPAEDKGLAA